jgi:hypothetical protein
LATVDDAQAVIDANKHQEDPQEQCAPSVIKSERLAAVGLKQQKCHNAYAKAFRKGKTNTPTADTDKALPPRKRKTIRPLSSTGSEAELCPTEQPVAPTMTPNVLNTSDSEKATSLPKIKRLKKHSKPSAAAVNSQDMRYTPIAMHVGAHATTMQQMVKETKDALINASLAHHVAMVST